MHAGPPDATYSEDLVDRLGRLVSTVDDAGRIQLDRGRSLVNALTDQLAAGQTETLYGLQTAAKTVRDRGVALERLASELPQELAAQLREVVSDLVQAIREDLGAQQEQYLSVLRESARATGAQLSTELEHAATSVVESAGRAKASQTAVRAAAVAAVEALEAATAAFADDAAGVIQAMTAVGEGFIGRLFQVLDERDAREQELDDLLAQRVDQLTQQAEKRLKAITAAMDAQLRRLEQRDLTERASNAAALQAVVDRLLAEPRGRLRELRSGLKGVPLPVARNPEPLHAEPAYQEVLDRPDPLPAKAMAKAAAKAPVKRPTKKAPAKSTPAKKAPAKRASATRSTSPRKTASKNEDT